MRNEPTQPLQEELEPAGTSVPDKKRTALLRYVVAMFAVAFLLVCISLIAETQNSSEHLADSKSALAKAEQLQEKNQKLEAEKKALEAQLKTAQQEKTDLQQQLTTLTEEKTTALAQRDKAWKDNEVLMTDNENQKIVYEALARVLIGPRTEGDVDYTRALETLNQMKQYLDPVVADLYNAWSQVD